MYQFYNITAYYSNQGNQEVITRLLNSFIEGLNSKKYLPRYVIMCPDLDIVKGTEFDYGANIIFKTTLRCLFDQLNKVINGRRMDLTFKRPVAMSSSFEPRLIWIKMIGRPDYNDKAMKTSMILRPKFNKVLDELVSKERHMHIMNIDIFEEDESLNLFKPTNNLTHEGKCVYWRQVDLQLKMLEFNEIRLRPTSTKMQPPKPKRSDNN